MRCHLCGWWGVVKRVRIEWVRIERVEVEIEGDGERRFRRGRRRAVVEVDMAQVRGGTSEMIRSLRYGYLRGRSGVVTRGRDRSASLE